MAISLERYATSKIRKVEDLEKTYTMGFRVEALATISAISTLTMQSKTKEEFTVRYKFLKQDATEFRYIKDWVKKVALANPNISFSLLNDRKRVFFTNGNGNILDIIYLMYGKETKENLLEVNYESDNIKIIGVIGNTMISRDNRKEQILFLNKRNIKNNVVINSADQHAAHENMNLSRQEVENLIQSLLNLNNPYTCPHGRPTTIKISKNFIKNKFIK